MRYESDDFQGLVPSVDPRRSDKLFAIGGRNYVLDALGPKSPFGNRLLTPNPLGKPEHAQGCRLPLRGGDRVFTMTGDAILEWRESEGVWRYVYVTGDTTIAPYRWTYGYLNGIMYFCHPAVGLLAYNITTNSCLPLVTPGVPEEPIAMIINNGRLVVIDDTYFSWSAPGNGLDFVPRLGGAGQQEIKQHVAGDPIMVSGYARGCITWTSGGVMRSEFTADGAVYRHRAVNIEYRPINSFCTIQMDDNTIVMLDERGLYKSQGETPEPLTPIFNEFLIDYLQKWKLKLGQNVRLEWDNLKKQLYVSLSLSEVDPIYERAFVLYPAVDKWGTFDESHYGIMPWLVTESTREGDYFGFVDSSGRPRYWTYVGSRETFPTTSTLNMVSIDSDIPPHHLAGEDATILSSAATVNVFDPTPYILGERGFYGAEGYGVVAPSTQGLDSVLHLGYVRVRSEDSYDRLSEVTWAFVGSVVSGPQNQVSVDFNVLPPVTPQPELSDLVGTEDFGLERANYVNHGFRIIGTKDGRTFFQDDTPSLVEFNEAGRHYSTSVSGVWNILEFTASAVGEAFHIQALELTVVDAGRLN